jgi:hypothetical protein
MRTTQHRISAPSSGSCPPVRRRSNVQRRVATIVDRVRRQGDRLLDFAWRFDRPEGSMEVGAGDGEAPRVLRDVGGDPAGRAASAALLSAGRVASS